MSGEAIAPRIAGGPGVDVTPDGTISSAGGSAVTPFQFLPVPTATTTGPGLVTFMTVPIQVTQAGRILLMFSASVEVEIVLASTSFQGAAFGFLWDGQLIPPLPPSALSQTAFMEIDAAGGDPDTFSNGVGLTDVVPASLATVGPHTLEVQFEGLAAESKVDIFDGSGSLVIMGVVP